MKWLIDNILKALDNRTKIRVLVHEAIMIGSQIPMYFVKVINISTEKDLTITHIWVKDTDKELDIINLDRPLPFKLEKSDIWETWFEKNKIKDKDKVFQSVRVELSDGKIYKSIKNVNVRPIGFVA
jgi:hypothetical protein